MLPILVFRLQRVPAFVVAKHLLAELCTAVFFGFETIPNTCLKGGLQILHGSIPSFSAFSMLNDDETFFTIRQSDKWYLEPVGVL